MPSDTGDSKLEISVRGDVKSGVGRGVVSKPSNMGKRMGSGLVCDDAKGDTKIEEAVVGGLQEKSSDEDEGEKVSTSRVFKLGFSGQNSGDLRVGDDGPADHGGIGLDDSGLQVTLGVADVELEDSVRSPNLEESDQSGLDSSYTEVGMAESGQDEAEVNQEPTTRTEAPDIGHGRPKQIDLRQAKLSLPKLDQTTLGLDQTEEQTTGHARREKTGLRRARSGRGASNASQPTDQETEELRGTVLDQGVSSQGDVVSLPSRKRQKPSSDTGAKRKKTLAGMYI